MRQVRRRRRRTALVQFHGADVGHDANHRKPGTRFVAPQGGIGGRADSAPGQKVSASVRLTSATGASRPQLCLEKRATRNQPKIERLEPVAGDARILDRRLAALLEHTPVDRGRCIRSALIVERHEVGDRRGVRARATRRVRLAMSSTALTRAAACVVRRAGEIDAHGHQVRRVVAQRHTVAARRTCERKGRARSSISASAICATMSTLCTRRWTRLPARPDPSRNGFCKRRPAASNAGAIPNARPVTSAIDERIPKGANVQRPVHVRGHHRIGRGTASCTHSMPYQASGNAKTPATSASSTDSMQQLTDDPAAAGAKRAAQGDFAPPSAPRASSRFATFAQAISTSTVVAPISAPVIVRSSLPTPSCRNAAADARRGAARSAGRKHARREFGVGARRASSPARDGRATTRPWTRHRRRQAPASSGIQQFASARKPERRRHHADDRVRQVVEPDHAADRRGIGLIAPVPQRVADRATPGADA